MLLDQKMQNHYHQFPVEMMSREEHLVHVSLILSLIVTTMTVYIYYSILCENVSTTRQEASELYLGSHPNAAQKDGSHDTIGVLHCRQKQEQSPEVPHHYQCCCRSEEGQGGFQNNTGQPCHVSQINDD